MLHDRFPAARRLRTSAVVLLLCASLGACSNLTHRLPAGEQASVWGTPYAGRSENIPAHRQPGHVTPVASYQAGTQPGGIWAEMRAQMSLPVPKRPRMAAAEMWLEQHRIFIERSIERSRKYLPFVLEKIEQHGLPVELALLPIVESGYRPLARSSSNAAGLWQFLPTTGRQYGLKQNWWYDGRRDVIHSTSAAIDYLRKLHSDFDGNWLLALAAYNCGEGTVQHAIEENQAAGLKTDFWSLDLPRETSDYVPRLLALAAVVADPERYAFSLPHIPARPYFDVVHLKRPINLRLAANLAGMSLGEFRSLNPGFKRNVSAPGTPLALAIPAAKVKQFRKKLATVPIRDRRGGERHRVIPGDSLYVLARRFHTTVATLRRMNHLASNTIRAGSELMVPGIGTQLASARPNGSERPETTRYAVRPGDSLWVIARRFGLSVHALARANALSTDATLHPGEKLRIAARHPARNLLVAQRASHSPAGGAHRIRYTVRKGDSLWRISRKFQVSVRSLKRWNTLEGDTALHPGQRIDLFVDTRGERVSG